MKLELCKKETFAGIPCRLQSNFYLLWLGDLHSREYFVSSRYSSTAHFLSAVTQSIFAASHTSFEVPPQ